MAIAEGDKQPIKVDPSATEVDKAKSVHVLGFTSGDELLLAESQGSFSVDEWDEILKTGQRVCSQNQEDGADTAMAGSDLESPSIKAFIRSVMQTKTAQDLHWK